MNDAPVQTTNYVADPGRIADLARRIREGELTPADLVRRCLERAGSDFMGPRPLKP